jgi:hypothetical protein
MIYQSIGELGLPAAFRIQNVSAPVSRLYRFHTDFSAM